MASLSEIIRALAGPVAIHLWQSTLFGLAAACTTLMLKGNGARLRFWIWFLASVKFLLPFALLVHLGTCVGGHILGLSQTSFASATEIINSPFVPAPSHMPSGLPHSGQLHAWAPLVLAALWLTGTFSLLLMWGLRWLRVRQLKVMATPLASGMEVDVLRALTSTHGPHGLPILLSLRHVEPGVFGIWKPVLLWPASMSRELSEGQMKGILAHEVCHVRQKDNLTATVQMLVEAMFWFHPLVWWFGSRQMEERERACDENVLQLGSPPAVYAESILTACRFCVEASPPCVAGVNGSNLKKRIARIMNYRGITSVSTSKQLILSSLALAAITAPVLFGISSPSRAMAQAGRSEVSSGPLRITGVTRNNSGSMMTLIKHPDGGTFISNITVKNLIEMAYSLKDYQLSGGPDWLDKDRFDIAYTGGASPDAGGMVSGSALKEILAERFGLVLHQETKAGPAFALVVGKEGIKFPTATPPNAPGTDEPLLTNRVMIKDGRGQILITGGPGGLADVLSTRVGRPIVDETGLTGIYTISFHWTTAETSGDSISKELQQQLGLRLVPQEDPVTTAVVDHVAIPMEG